MRLPSLIASLALLLLAVAPAAAEVLKVDGRERSYLIRRDPGSGPLPLLLVLHGGGTRAGQMERYVALTEPARGAGYVVVYPQGYRNHWNDGRLEVDSDAVRENVDDVGFLLALIDHLAAKGWIDPARVYVAGISNGAMMSLRLACAAADRLAGVMTVVGSLGVETAAGCAPARPLPLLMLAGTADPLVPYGGGAVTVVSDERGRVIAVEETLALFAAHNGCEDLAPQATLDPADDGIAVDLLAGTGCGAPAVLVRYHGGGHGWPGAGQYMHHRLIGKIPEGPAANALLLDFAAGTLPQGLP